ncbi:MAG: LamG domain-containing protein, partial [Sedimentisphaerales bacterium]|nr:LamG domain-containing protein [Sedimentisphaerales bacterium]
MCKKMNYFFPLLLAITIAGIGMAQGLDPNMVAWWKLDEGTGQIVLDETAYWNDGTLNGGPLWTDGRIGSALDFDGTDDYIDCGNPESLNITEAITVALWVNTDTVAGGAHRSYLIKGDTSYALKQNSGGRIEFFVYIGGWQAVTFPGSTSFNNVWHHLAGTYDGSQIKLYVDGELRDTKNYTGAIGTNGSIVSIGSDSGTRRFCDARIDDTRIYNRALSIVEIKKLANPENASSPIPADGSVTTDTQVTLQWDAGLDAVTHNLYFSDDEQAVVDGTAPLTALSQTSHGPLALELGKTYYWRVDEVASDGATTYTGEVWSFTIQPLSAYNPSPANGAKYVDINADLAWNPGFNAVSHDVYFGTDRNAMLNADSTSPEFKGNHTELALELDTLEYDTVYYWQVNERNNDMTLTNGEIWSFRTIPETPITDPNLVGWWKLDDDGGSVILDWSGLGNNGTVVGEPLWITGQIGGALDFDGIDDCIDIGNPASLDINDVITVMAWIKMDAAANGEDQSFVTKGNNSYGLRHAGTNNIQFRLNDTILVDSPVDESFSGQWRHVAGTYDGSQLKLYIDGSLKNTADSPGTIPSSIYNVNIGRESVGNRFLYDGAIDDIQIHHRVLAQEDIAQAMRGDPLLAWNPNPGNGALLDLIAFDGLSWSAGDEAAEHDVYFGTDKDTVADANTSTLDVYRGRQTSAGYIPPEAIEGGRTYFWRIDEINNDSTVSKGITWTFTIADYLIVDDFESYNDLDVDLEGSNRIYLTWFDGYDNPSQNGSTMGYPTPNFADGEHFVDTEITHGGSQSAPIFYNNTTASLSEVTANTSDLPIGTNWTIGSPDTLSLWIYGDPNNSTTE